MSDQDIARQLRGEALQEAANRPRDPAPKGSGYEPNWNPSGSDDNSYSVEEDADLIAWAARRLFPSVEWDEEPEDEIHGYVREKLLEDAAEALAGAGPDIMRALGFAPDPIFRGAVGFHRPLACYPKLGPIAGAMPVLAERHSLS